MNTENSHVGESARKMSEYEFTDKENEYFGKVHALLLHISLLMFGISFLLMFLGHNQPGIAGWITMIAASLCLVLGVVYCNPLVYFRRVETTSSDDIIHLMVGMDNLRTAFTIATWVVLMLNGLVLVKIVMFLT